MDQAQVRTVLRLYGVLAIVSGIGLAGLSIVAWFALTSWLERAAAQAPGGVDWILRFGCGAGGFVVLLAVIVLASSSPLARWITGCRR